MKHPQVVVYEADGWLAEQVRDLTRENGWLLRESRQPDACLALLRTGNPSVLLLKLERNLLDELAFLARIHEFAPDCPVVVFSDVKMENAGQRANLAGLAHDLGASYVLFPPLTQNLVEDLTSGLLEAAIRRILRPHSGRNP